MALESYQSGFHTRHYIIFFSHVFCSISLRNGFRYLLNFDEFFINDINIILLLYLCLFMNVNDILFIYIYMIYINNIILLWPTTLGLEGL